MELAAYTLRQNSCKSLLPQKIFATEPIHVPIETLKYTNEN